MAEFKDPKVTIKIPRALYNRIKSIIEDSGFDSVTDFIVYVLRDFAAGVGDAAGKSSQSKPPVAGGAGGANDSRAPGDPEDVSALTAAEIRKVRERLKRLGYL